MKRAVILGLIILFATSCSEAISEQVSTGSISGIVADKTTGEPVSTVSLALSPGGKKTVTGSDGTFLFSDMEAGAYTVDLQKEGYKLESYSIVVFEGKNSELHLLIERIPAIVTADREVLDFGENESVTQLSFGIVNSGYVDLTWHSVYDCEWIKETSPKKNAEQVLKYGKTATIVVTIDRTKLPYGNNETNIIIYSDNGRSQVKITAVNANALPVSNTKEVTDILTSTATMNAETASEGSPKYTKRGFVYGKNHNPTTADVTITAEVNEKSNYSAKVSGLQPGATYYVRAFAENSKGIAYSSNEVSFTTIESITSVSTSNVTEVDVVNGKATFNGSITAAGNPVYSEKGFCYNTSGEPTTAENKITVSGSNSGEYVYRCAGLGSNTTYYVRAYAIQCGITYYGTTTSFSTDQSATTISTSAATNITSSSATLNGSIIKAGSPAYSEKGFCYCRGYTPTINDTKITVSGNNSGNFSVSISNLEYNTSYYFRAYAIQNGKTIYGESLYFRTSYIQAEVQTSEATNIGYNSLTFNGSVTSVGDPYITERGFCYSDSYSFPSISHNRIKVSGVAYGTFKADVKGLSESTTYYIRSYVIQDGTVYYGNVKTAETYTQPVVATQAVKNIRQVENMPIYYQATLYGAFYDGDPGVTEWGFVYDCYDNPTVSKNKVVAGTWYKKDGDAYWYSLTVTNFPANKYIYYRAYVKTRLGYVYGETLQFQTYY